MNITESFISSLFAHLIFFLFLAAVSMRGTTILSGQRALSVDLTAGRSADAIARESADNIPPSESVELTQKEEIRPDAAIEDKTPPEVERPQESAAVNEASPETVPKTETAAEEDISLSGWQKELAVFHTKAFAQNLGTSIEQILNSEISRWKGGLPDGSYGRVKLYYSETGFFQQFEIESDSAGLKSILEQVQWAALPYPGKYYLKLRALDVRMLVVNGKSYIELALL